MRQGDLLPSTGPLSVPSGWRDILAYVFFVLCFWVMVLLAVMMAPTPLAQSVGRCWLIAVTMATLPLGRGLRVGWHLSLLLMALPVSLVLLHVYVVYDLMQFSANESIENLWLVAGLAVYGAFAFASRWLAVHLVSRNFRIFAGDDV